MGCAHNHRSFLLVVEGLNEFSGCNEIDVHKGLIELITKNASFPTRANDVKMSVRFLGLTSAPDRCW